MPVGPAETVDKLAQVADDVVVLLAPADSGAVGAFYDDFNQVSDDKVVEIMQGTAAAARASSGQASPGTAAFPRRA